LYGVSGAPSHKTTSFLTHGIGDKSGFASNCADCSHI
jgi:hypothetical protein